MTFASSNATYFQRYAAREWTDNQTEVIDFARDMVNAVYLHTADDVIEFLQKPWHWHREHEWWVANGMPDSWEMWDKGIDTEFEVTE